jgi:hypothetical protein
MAVLVIGGGVELFSGQMGIALFTWTIAAGVFYLYVREWRDALKQRETPAGKMDSYARARSTVKIPADAELVCQDRFWLWLENATLHLFAATWDAGSYGEHRIPVQDVLCCTSCTPDLHAVQHDGEKAILVPTGVDNTEKAYLYYRAMGRTYALEMAAADYASVTTMMTQQDGCLRVPE